MSDLIIDGVIDCSTLLNHFKFEGLLDCSAAQYIINQANEVMLHESNIVRIQGPVICMFDIVSVSISLSVIGDLHGQFYDLVRIFEVAHGKGASLTDHKFVFLGDYVDRGSFSCEIILYLYALKIRYPDSVFLVRGNHESRQMTESFNFHSEVLHKYSEDVYSVIMDSFQSLPIGVIIDGEYLALHGGISPDLHTLSQLMTLDRFVEPPVSGLLCDVLWSDPHPQFDSVTPIDDFIPNTNRGCSYYFSHAALCRFLNSNGLSCLIKAHEVHEKGHKIGPVNIGSVDRSPSYISVFSAPNYCDMFNNKGAFLQIKNKDINIIEFDASPHPYVLPNFMNLFTWSVPFMCEKVSDVVHRIVQDSDQGL